MSSYNQNNSTGYYYCSDTTCRARCLIKFSLDAKTENNKINNDQENFNLTNNHNRFLRTFILKIKIRN